MTKHSELVSALVKPGLHILHDLTPDKVDMLHMGIGVCGEAGELIDAIKKVVIYNKPIDRANVVEELGDLEFYMEGLRQTLRISREETLNANVQKLLIRYPNFKFTDKHAQDRLDKQ